MKIPMEITIALISSLVALIVALFSFFSSRTSTKVEAMKGYLDFLRQKMSKLEEKLDYMNAHQDNANSKFTEQIADGLKIMNEAHGKLFQSSQYLFNFKKNDFKTLQEKQKKIEFSMGAYSAKLHDIELKDEFKNDIFELVKIPSLISEMHSQIQELIVEELEETYNVFEKLSLKIKI
jgi:hypothetical protein